MDDPVLLIVVGFELALWCAGVVLLARLVFNPAHRASFKQPRLQAWPITLFDFGLFLLCIMAGAVLFSIAGKQVANLLGLRGDAVTVCLGAAAQLGMLAGYFAFRARHVPPPALPDPAVPPPAPSALSSNVFLSGLQTFLIALPFLIAAVRIWETVLQLFGLPVDRQDLVGMFANAESPLMLIVMITLAIVVAPITEELVFRAGLYRFLRTRIPRWIALIMPALFFASLHVDWQTFRGLASLVPLLALAVVFSLAYEHTGRIGTVIVAHALFNLNTLLMILGGAADE